MLDELPTAPLVIRLATPADIPVIDLLDSYSISPTRNIHREMEKYFGSVDPSTHEKTLILHLHPFCDAIVTGFVLKFRPSKPLLLIRGRKKTKLGTLMGR